MKKRWTFAIVLTCVLPIVYILIGCGSAGDISQAVNATLTAISLQTPSPAPAPADSPEKAAAIWLDALLNLDGNVLAQRTCRAQREAVKTQAMWDSALTAMGQLLVGQKTEGEISGLKFSLEAASGDWSWRSSPVGLCFGSISAMLSPSSTLHYTLIPRTELSHSC